DARGVERAPDDLVADTRQVLHTTAAHQHHGVLLEVVPLARDVRGHLHAAGEAHTGHLAQRRVRLLGGGGVHAGAHAPPLGGTLERRCGLLAALGRPARADQLLTRGHGEPLGWGKDLPPVRGGRTGTKGKPNGGAEDGATRARTTPPRSGFAIASRPRRSRTRNAMVARSEERRG